MRTITLIIQTLYRNRNKLIQPILCPLLLPPQSSFQTEHRRRRRLSAQRPLALGPAAMSAARERGRGLPGGAANGACPGGRLSQWARRAAARGRREGAVPAAEPARPCVRPSVGPSVRRAGVAGRGRRGFESRPWRRRPLGGPGPCCAWRRPRCCAPRRAVSGGRGRGCGGRRLVGPSLQHGAGAAAPAGMRRRGAPVSGRGRGGMREPGERGDAPRTCPAPGNAAPWGGRAPAGIPAARAGAGERRFHRGRISGSAAGTDLGAGSCAFGCPVSAGEFPGAWLEMGKNG